VLLVHTITLKLEELLKNNLVVKLIKGFIIGSSMLVPGVSGGTMAIILGIYDDLIHAVSSFKENVRANGILLLQYGIAGVLGVILLSGPMLEAVTIWNKPMMFLFLGAIIGSMPPLYKKATVFKMKKINIASMFAGLLIAYLITLFPEGMLAFDADSILISVLILFAAGIFIAIALVLPGISASYILLMLGIYDLTLIALKSMNLFFLIPMTIGVLAGVFLTAGILEREMNRHPQFTYMLIIGFMLGSLLEVFPGLPSGIAILPCILTFALGFGTIFFIGRYNYKV
jgi:putative membrane protein